MGENDPIDVRESVVDEEVEKAYMKFDHEKLQTELLAEMVAQLKVSNYLLLQVVKTLPVIVDVELIEAIESQIDYEDEA